MFSKYEGIADITLLSRNMLSKSMNSIPLLMNGISMKCLMWLIPMVRCSSSVVPPLFQTSSQKPLDRL